MAVIQAKEPRVDERLMKPDHLGLQDSGKVCTKCGERKFAEDFYVSTARSDGRSCYCRSCSKEMYQKNKNRIRENYRECYKSNKNNLRDKTGAYYLKNKEKIKVKDRAYCLKNKEKIRVRMGEYYQKNRDEMLMHFQSHYRENRDKILEHGLLYRQDNKEEIKKRRHDNRDKDRAREAWRYKNCVEFKIKKSLRSRVYDALNGRNKSKHTMELIGCSVLELMRHLEAMFKSGMSWDNYGKWHIDHIRPCASFDLTEPGQQMLCFNWKNLQPLWAVENLVKSSKYVV